MKMPDLKNINWPLFALEKGHFLLAGTGAVVGGLLLFYSLGSGITAPSPSGNEEKLKKENTRVKNSFAAAKPDPSNVGPTGDVPSLTKYIGIDPVADDAVKPIDALAYMAGEPLLIPEDPAEIKRRMPKVLQPIEVQVDFARVPLRAATFNDDFTKVFMLAKGGAGAAGAGPGGPAGPGAGGGRGGMPGGMGAGGGMAGGMGMGGGMAGMAGGMGMGGGMAANYPPTISRMLKDKYESDPRPILPITPVNVEDLGKSGGKPADQAVPLRMAVIAASFPYKKQLQEFRQKLKLPNIQTVLSEPSFHVDPRTKFPLPAFRFLKVDLQRRTQLPNDSFSAWEDIKLEDSFRNYVNLALGRAEVEDDLLGLVSYPGLVMPKLLTFYSQADTQATLANNPATGRPGTAQPGGVAPVKPKGPDLANQPKLYPEPEKGLPKLAAMLKEVQDKKLQAAITQTKPKFSTSGSFDIFSGGATPPPVAGLQGGMMGGAPGGMLGGALGGAPGGMLGGAPGGALGGAPGGMLGGFPGGQDGDAGGPGGLAFNPTGQPVSTALNQADLYAADLALVRVYDPTVKPGETYQYRLKVVMLNPNYRRQDVASTGFSKEAEIVCEEWYEIPGSYSTPSDLNCYVTEAKTSPDQSRVNLEVYKWATAVKRGNVPINLGDWLKTVLSVGKCEFVGRTSRIELVPYWRADVDGYSFVPIIIPPQPNAKRGIDVEFKPDTGEKGDYFLVDFDGPNYRYDRLLTKDGKVSRIGVTENDRSVEIFLMSSNGKLLMRSSINDEGDPDRKRMEALVESHRNAARDSIRSGKGSGGPAGGPGGTGNGGGTGS